MTGTFSSVNTALTALRYQRVALDVAGNNIANAATKGYVRRSLVGESMEASHVALWSRYDGYGDGVGVASVNRMVDPLLDRRVRREEAGLSYLQTTSTALQHVDNGIGEPGPNGVAAALSAYRGAWHDLTLNPGGDAARQQVLSRAATLADAIHTQVNNVAGEEADQRLRLVNVVGEINTAAAELADLNREILAADVNGSDTSTLRDQRDALALQLAQQAGAVTTVRSDGMFDVTVGGVDLVSGRQAGTLAIATGVTPTGDADGNPITFQIDLGGPTAVPTPLGGEIGGMHHLLSDTLPTYRAGLDQVVRDFADTVNAQHAAGYDLAGNAGGAFFAYDPADPAATLSVAITDGDLVAAASVAGGTLDGGNADLLGTAGTADADYQRLVNSFGSQVDAVDRQRANQAALTASIQASWEQQAGVNLDEETVNLVSAQHAYEAAARLMTAVDEMLDTLINRTGIVGR
ncbi:flagellar hook-associated protein FlgK [Nocardioides humilatus]|uniref:Flagellar hook-associated protein 1 n=1 Tax=Nocardioides humilatus TaxID=2607660 RepID=A0A5B1LD49_9ACTN|nr:flagellar hook-associated protein FlgK [Nocardioides humilatus]KAA1417720.1 flagellar hook-associated protein FlgK [Nocardioides humilatus]